MRAIQVYFRYSTILFAAIFLFSGIFNASAKIQTPESYFGFEPGADRMLFSYERLIDYLEDLDDESPKLKMVKAGWSPMGRPMYITFISSETNINNLDSLKNINRQLALNSELSDSEKKNMVSRGKVFVLATMSMHSSEVGPSQAVPRIAYELLTEESKNYLLDEIVLMIVPCHNPDGMDMVVKNYYKYKGTKYEGSSMPGVYHKYVGHDNNRDFITLSQSDTKAISAIFSKDWFPQVMVEKHQMGSTGPRYFVPPMHDPIAENIDAAVWNWTWVFGSNMSTDMTREGLSGISQHYLFDDYWPGSTETCIWKSTVGMLTEAASIRYAKPIFIEQNELKVYGKGLSEYKKSINMPEPWPGGWWRLGDIVDYECESTYSILKTALMHKEELLTFRNDLCKREVKRGRSEAPFYYIMPEQQHDRSEFVNLVNLLKEHGVNVHKLQKSITVNGRNFNQGDVVVTLAQPFRAFIKEVMEKQKFPLRHYTPGGKIIKPYDITSWSLPEHRGVSAVEINEPSDEILQNLELVEDRYTLFDEIPEEFWAVVFDGRNNESFRAVFDLHNSDIEIDRLEEDTMYKDTFLPAGSFVVLNQTVLLKELKEMKDKLTVKPLFIKSEHSFKTKIVEFPRIALVESFFHDMDAGWTRYVFDKYHIQYSIIRPGNFSRTEFSKNFDVVIFPDTDKSILLEGKWKSNGEYYISNYPPEYAKGIGEKGFEKLMTFLNDGGKIIAWGRSARLFTNSLKIKHSKDEIEEFKLPVSDISKQLKDAGVYCPGSLIRTKLLEGHPLTLGMPEELGVFFRGRPVFSTTIPGFDMDRRVIGRIASENVLISGYCEKKEKLQDKSVLVWLKKGRGQLILSGFNPQFRASTQAGYKLLFNSIILPKLN